MGRKTQAARVIHGAAGTHTHTLRRRVTGFNPPTLTVFSFSNRKHIKKIKSEMAGLLSKGFNGDVFVY